MRAAAVFVSMVMTAAMSVVTLPQKTHTQVQQEPQKITMVPSERFGVTRNVLLDGNNYGARWDDSDGDVKFYDGNGKVFVRDAKAVIDVSEHQHVINWDSVKNADVDGAIIRIGYGWDNGFDKQAIRNINECKRLGIPFGVYLYSYAEYPEDGASEGAGLVNLLQSAGVSPSDLSYPVYYDLEPWSWSGHSHPTSPAVYQDIVASWWTQLEAAGYTNLGVYSYTNYLRSALNSRYIHERTSWVASYGSRTGFNFSTAFRGWQYTSSGSIAGIKGKTDLNAFGTGEVSAAGDENPTINMTWIVRNDDIAVGAAVQNVRNAIEYRWLSYDVAKKHWAVISDWSSGNWSSWRASNGIYWLHLEVRNASTKQEIARKTIAFNYNVNNPTLAVAKQSSQDNKDNKQELVATKVSGTYAGWSGKQVLLGAVTNNPKGYTIIKIYDYLAKKWISQFKGPWAYWNPKPGIYWTHFEAYTPDGHLADTKTYPFGV